MKAKDKRSGLRKEYDNAVLRLKQIDFDSEGYQKQLKHVERLHKLLMDEESHKDKLSLDAILAGAVNLTGIGLILSWEHLNTIRSKAINFVLKGRLR